MAVMTVSQDMKTAAIVGASGYTGVEMIRLAMAHPRLTIVALTGARHAGRAAADVHPALLGCDLPDLVRVKDVDWDDVDVAFCCLPHGASEEVVAEIAGEVETVIDLSADFRLKDKALYEATYGRSHGNATLLEEAVYGLSEWARDQLPGAGLVACPGCFPTCTLLALAPLLAEGVIDPEDIRITAMTGVSGAGRKAHEAFSFAELSDSAHPYGLDGHRHAPEMDQFLTGLSDMDVQVSFVPQLVPMNRGMVATIFVRRAGAANADLRQIYADVYAEQPFVQLLPEGIAPKTRNVRGSNHCHLNAFEDRGDGRSVLVSAIDNLTKGSSGQAIQNYNLTQGWDECLGLEMTPLFP